MQTANYLIVAGIPLLAVAALLGFVQFRVRHDERAFARWRVVHASGTAGAVQLLALAAIWPVIGVPVWSWLAALGIAISAWAFFLGPLMGALGKERWARLVNGVGSVAAVPGYLVLLTLPFSLP